MTQQDNEKLVSILNKLELNDPVKLLEALKDVVDGKKIESIFNEMNMVTVNTEITYGEFAWCGNTNDGSVSGYYMSEIYDSTYPEKKVLLTVKINMDQSLVKKVDRIEIRDSTGFLAYYTVEAVQKENNCRLKINEHLLGTDFKILLLKFLPDDPNLPFSVFRRQRTETVYKTTFKVPQFKNTEKVCSICLDDVETDKYITPCGHIFHFKCIWSYLAKNDLLKKKPAFCADHCKHSNKPSDFACPMCKHVIKSI
jgi:hypothetical protein